MSIEEYISSGILETYVLGVAAEDERREVERMAAAHPEVRKEIAAISEIIEKFAMQNAVEPHPAIKPMLMATIDYSVRLEKGEIPAFPPVLNPNSKAEDYHAWLSRPDMIAPASFEEIFAKIIGYTPEVTSAVVWIRNLAPNEVHANEHERFLILEGTCDVIVDDIVHSLSAGDYFAIPLHAPHRVIVTSDIPCKVILQRVAA